MMAPTEQTLKRVMVDMSATLLHHGHIRLIQQAARHGVVVIGLTSDREIHRTKGYHPELSFEHRLEVVAGIKGVVEVVEVPWFVTEEILDKHRIDLLVHGSDNSNPIAKERLLVLPRTPGISSSRMRQAVQRVLSEKANQKLMLTPGPAALLHENLSGLRPVFGRGDQEYAKMQQSVETWVRALCGQDQLVWAQGSATFALELALHTFIRGRILCVDTGYYSDRLKWLLGSHESLDHVAWDELDQVQGKYDWVLAVYSETSRGIRLHLPEVEVKVRQLGAKLFVDATGSIGLEPDHHLADVLAFSSCKGLFGLVGACFIGHRNGLPEYGTDHFYFNLDTHRNRMVTGPYHPLSSLVHVLPIHDQLVARVKKSKQLFVEAHHTLIAAGGQQPLLCTYLRGTVEPLDDQVVLYSPRSDQPGSIVCHLGEVHQEEVYLNRRIRVTPLEAS